MHLSMCFLFYFKIISSAMVSFIHNLYTKCILVKLLNNRIKGNAISIL